jgi:hypothetical protein
VVDVTPVAKLSLGDAGGTTAAMSAAGAASGCVPPRGVPVGSRRPVVVEAEPSAPFTSGSATVSVVATPPKVSSTTGARAATAGVNAPPRVSPDGGAEAAVSATWVTTGAAVCVAVSTVFWEVSATGPRVRFTVPVESVAPFCAVSTVEFTVCVAD